jgi:hypothetical protein
VTQAIINTMSIHGTSTEGVHPTVIDGVTLDSILSPGSSWRSARATPMTLPGNNHVIEACSPKYAKLAMSTGLHHVTALPCEITVQIVDQDGNGSTETLVISYLDPHFMLNALFADITEEEKLAFAPIPGNIMNDLQKIVRAALEVNLGLSLNDGARISTTCCPDGRMRPVIQRGLAPPPVPRPLAERPGRFSIPEMRPSTMKLAARTVFRPPAEVCALAHAVDCTPCPTSTAACSRSTNTAANG